MMRIMQLLLIGFLIFFFTLGFAQEGLNSDGNVGLLNISTPNTLGKGGFAIGMLGRYSDYNDRRAKVVEALLGGTYGLTERLDISLLVPYAYINSDKFGIGNFVASAKYRLSNDSGILLALSSAIYFPTGKKTKNLGSETFGFQLTINSGIRWGRFEIPINFGFGSRDYFRKRIRESVNTEIYIGSAGVIYKLLPSLTLILEGVVERIPDFSDEGIYFQLGGILKISKLFLLKGSAGVAIFNDVDAVPDVRSIVGLSYLVK